MNIYDYVGMRLTVRRATCVGRHYAKYFLESTGRQMKFTNKRIIAPGDYITVVGVMDVTTPSGHIVIVEFDDGFGWLLDHELNLSPLVLLARCVEEE